MPQYHGLCTDFPTILSLHHFVWSDFTSASQGQGAEAHGLQQRAIIVCSNTLQHHLLATTGKKKKKSGFLNVGAEKKQAFWSPLSVSFMSTN